MKILTYIMKLLTNTFGAVLVLAAFLSIFALPSSIMDKIPAALIVIYSFAFGIGAFWVIGTLLENITENKRGETPLPETSDA
jgi:hypothetical protein